MRLALAPSDKMLVLGWPLCSHDDLIKMMRMPSGPSSGPFFVNFIRMLGAEVVLEGLAAEFTFGPCIVRGSLIVGLGIVAVLIAELPTSE